MKVIEHIANALGRNSEPQFSFEIVPPARGRSVKDIIDIAEALVPLDPQWIDVTSHASTAYYQEKSDGHIEKRIFRKRPGTLGICGVIQNRFKIDTVAHVLCEGFTREETEDALIELNYLGIHNVLALKGDSPNHQKAISANKSVNHFAIDLVDQIQNLKQGQFVDGVSECEPLDFCVGVAGYPEKHFEAANFKTDLQNLKKKVDAGAEYIVTQMFFDNQKFFNFVKECREIGITVPIVPGLKVFRSLAQLKSIPKTFHVDLPDQVVDEVMKNPDFVRQIGENWATKQVQGLIDNGHNNIHFYIMNDVKVVTDIVKAFRN